MICEDCIFYDYVITDSATGLPLRTHKACTDPYINEDEVAKQGYVRCIAHTTKDSSWAKEYCLDPDKRPGEILRDRRRRGRRR